MFRYIIKHFKRQPLMSKEIKGEGVDELSAHYHARQKMKLWTIDEMRDGHRIEVLNTDYSYKHISDVFTVCRLVVEYRSFKATRKV